MTHYLNGSTNEMVVFGSGKPGPLNDVYIFTGDVGTGNWAQWTPPVQDIPAIRCCMLWVYDPLQGKILMFGGQYEPKPNARDDTWSWTESSGWSCLLVLLCDIA
jgi:hypothetical protein